MYPPPAPNPTNKYLIGVPLNTMNRYSSNHRSFWYLRYSRLINLYWGFATTGIWDYRRKMSPYSQLAPIRGRSNWDIWERELGYTIKVIQLWLVAASSSLLHSLLSYIDSSIPIKFCSPGGTFSWLIPQVVNDSTLSKLCATSWDIILFAKTRPSPLFFYTNVICIYETLMRHPSIRNSPPSNWAYHTMLTQVGALKPVITII